MPALRECQVMNRQANLLDLIEERKRALRLSDRQISLAVTGKPDFIRDLKRRGHAPKAWQAAKLARVLELPLATVQEAIVPELPADQFGQAESQQFGEELTDAQFDLCYVIGEVEAGVWRAAVELPRDEWEPMVCDRRPEYSGAIRFALRVRGQSMNRYYPPGALLDCIRFVGSGHYPRAGDHVIVYRRGPGDLVEATVKELVRTDAGWELWPRSDHPDHQEPLRLARLPDDDQNDDVRIVARVIGSYQRRL